MRKAVASSKASGGEEFEDGDASPSTISPKSGALEAGSFADIGIQSTGIG
jgi:hypothetical protein